MKKMNTNYTCLEDYFSGKDFDEKYAIISHYIQLQGLPEEKKYKESLINLGIDISKIPSKKAFNKKINTPFVNRKNDFTFVDLFSGIGGFRLALQNCGGECVFSSEWDDAAKQTYFENYGEVPFGDITKNEIKDMIPEHFDVLCAGFPCQAFSIAGYRRGFEDVRGTLFFDVAEILERYRPKAFYLENVKNLKSHDNGRTFKTIMDVLENRLHYKVDSMIMNPCIHANVPQNRERIFIVGFDPEQVNLEKFLVKDDLKNSDLKFNFPFPKPIPLNRTIHNIIDTEIDDQKLFYRPGHLYYKRMLPVITNPDTVYQWRRVYIRENQNNLCPTLTANMGEGGHNVPIVYIPNHGIRKFSPEECLGFQGFPVNTPDHHYDNPYRYPNTIAQSKKYKQAGNSVTMPLIQKVAEQIKNIIF